MLNSQEIENIIGKLIVKQIKEPMTYRKNRIQGVIDTLKYVLTSGKINDSSVIKAIIENE